MRVSNLFTIKTFLCILLKTSAQCGFVIMCFITCLQFLTGRKAAFYRCRSDGELIGSIAAFAGSSLPSGWLLCNGSAVSRTTYAALFSVIGTTYGTGDGSTTFNLPNLIDKFIEGSATAGTTKAAGLPNISGTLRINPDGTNVCTAGEATGAFKAVGGSNIYAYSRTTTTLSDKNYAISFDAYRSSTLYGNSTTVQPPALTMKFAIYTGNTSLNKWKRTA